MIWGVDFGARSAGTTALACFDGHAVTLQQSTKGQDASRWLTDHFYIMRPSLVGIDAPLSLPGGYFSESFSDLHYRKADRLLQAMSPMFIGGLTARAIEWARTVEAQVIEVYPSALAQALLDGGRKHRKDVESFFEEVVKAEVAIAFDIDVTACARPVNIHQLDALLALLTVRRFEKDMARAYGDPEEGVIWV